MSGERFLYCRGCDALFRSSPFDRTPEFCWTSEGVTEIARDDRAAFLADHEAHPLETLRQSGASAHLGSAADPMAVSYWPVAGPAGAFVVEGRRATLGEPLQYRLWPGRLTTEILDVAISEDEIRACVDRALYPGVAPERKLAAFVAAFEGTVRALDPSCLEILYDVPGDDGLAIARLPDVALARLAMEVRRIFDPADAARVEQALAAHENDPAPLCVLVHQRTRVRR